MRLSVMGTAPKALDILYADLSAAPESAVLVEEQPVAIKVTATPATARACRDFSFFIRHHSRSEKHRPQWEGPCFWGATESALSNRGENHDRRCPNRDMGLRKRPDGIAFGLVGALGLGDEDFDFLGNLAHMVP